jgi:hypothetical protein
MLIFPCVSKAWIGAHPFTFQRVKLRTPSFHSHSSSSRLFHSIQFVPIEPELLPTLKRKYLPSLIVSQITDRDFQLDSDASSSRKISFSICPLIPSDPPLFNFLHFDDRSSGLSRPSPILR